MSDVDKTVNSINVSFSVDIDLSNLNKLKFALDNSVQGTVECSIAWDNLNHYYNYLIKRLDGECLAYMNIAKKNLKLQFGI
jgi:hypothetical protein